MLSFVAGLSFDSRCERSLSTAEVVVSVGPGPFFGWCCFGLLFDETQIWLGDLRVVVCRGFFPCLFWLFLLFVDFCLYMATVLCTALAIIASTSVRTEPRATSAIPEEKKIEHGCLQTPDTQLVPQSESGVSPRFRTSNHLEHPVHRSHQAGELDR